MLRFFSNQVLSWILKVINTILLIQTLDHMDEDVNAYVYGILHGFIDN